MHSSRMHTTHSSCPQLCVFGGVCLSACWHTHTPRCGPVDPLGVGLETPQVWAWRPPRPDPSTSPLGVGMERPSKPDPSNSPWVWSWKPARHAGVHTPPDLQGILGYHLQGLLGYTPTAIDLQGMLGYTPTLPHEQNDWQTRVKTLPLQTSFVSGNKQQTSK